MGTANNVTALGNLTRDPELTTTTSGHSVCKFGLATNRKGKREETWFADCEAWGRTAELIAEYCHKGDPLFVQGRMKTDQWEGRDGKRQSATRMVVEGMTFVRGGDAKSDDWVGDAKGVPPSAPPAGDAALDEDIPF